MSAVSLLASAPPEQVEAVWDDARGRLRQTLNDVTYRMVFERARAVRLTGDRITLKVDTEFCRSWIVQRHMSLLKDALFEVLGVQFISLGLLGEVLTRIYFESQGKSAYTVRSTLNLDGPPTRRKAG